MGDARDTVRMPGVVDHHVHLGLVDGARFRDSAVVEVHDLGWSPDQALRWRREGVGGATVRIAGPFLTPPGGYPKGRWWAPDAAVREVADVPAARSAILAAMVQGLDMVKLVLHAGFPPFDDRVLAALVAGAREAGLAVVAHVEGAGQAQRALDAGVDVLAHVPWTERLSDELVIAMARRCTWISTLAIHDDPDASRTAVANARRFVAAGGRLRYGTDLGNGDGPVGLRREEVLLLGEAGLYGAALIEALTGHVGGPMPEDRAVVGSGEVPADAEGIADWYLAARPVPADVPGETDDLGARAADLDATDPLAPLRSRFLVPRDVVAYLDGNSLGRPLEETPSHLSHFVRARWGGRLIRGWDEGWMEEPERLGDELGRVVLGAAAGQTVVGDSTSVLLYKAVRAAVALAPERTEIVHAAGDFPTDRFLLQGIAAELGLTLVPLTAPHDGGVTAEQVAGAVSDATAAVVLSHVAYRSAYTTDVAAATAAAHAVGAPVVWDLSHSACSTPGTWTSPSAAATST
jgi:hypothetical protein